MNARGDEPNGCSGYLISVMILSGPFGTKNLTWDDSTLFDVAIGSTTSITYQCCLADISNCNSLLEPDSCELPNFNPQSTYPCSCSAQETTSIQATSCSGAAISLCN
jgi:hypothetical protein